ncbi:MAG TPA: acyl-ACP--UDP-N-acetylglucosamine O-acyltransferase [Bacteroidota bacterium]|nr:acyl-ACP--UDP-N-acetylglucosamine O-acyltransferase [Bacteroidota bacterium]
MSSKIDPRSAVSSKAQLGDNVTVGPFAVIEDDVVIGDGTTIGPNAYIADGARIGKECYIHHGASISSVPQDLKFAGEKTTAEIGDKTVAREFVTVNRGTVAHGKTTVGTNCFMMAYAHVAHDCEVGNHVILANSVNMGGHVVIEDHAIIGGLVAIHQWSKIGCHAMIGGGFRVTKDVPPYALAGSQPLVFEGLNSLGLRRRNFSPQSIAAIEAAYNTIYHGQLNVSQALQKLREQNLIDEVRHIVEFIASSERGIIPSFRR